jgi:hypothetical protein
MGGKKEKKTLTEDNKKEGTEDQGSGTSIEYNYLSQIYIMPI